MSDESKETYSVEQIREAYANHAREDDWSMPVFYENSLISALRGEYDNADGAAERGTGSGGSGRG